MVFEQIILLIVIVSIVIYILYIITFIAGFFLPRKHFSAIKPGTSVIVAARDEEHCIEDCLNSLCTQTYPNEKFEVIVVNDQSKDNTEKIIKSLQQKFSNLKLINIKKRPADFAPKKYAISEAFKIATGEIILTTDADIIVKPTWIESIVSFFENDVGLVAGFSSVNHNQTGKIFQKFEALDFLMLLTATKGSIRIGLPVSCTGQNLSFRRKAFDEIGGFGDRGAKQSADDVLLLHRIRRHKKWKIVFADDPASYVETHATKSITDFLKQRIRWAIMGVGQFTKSIHLTIISIFTSIVNIGLLMFLLGFWLLNNYFMHFLLMGITVKFIVDFSIALIGSIYFKKSSWFWFFPFLFVLYMPYILIMSIFSIIGNFKWKEQVYIKGKVK